MVRKKKLPWGVLTVLLVLLLVGAYYMGGLFGMDGVNLLNWQNYLGYIIAHPLKSYWNEGTIGWMGIGFFAWLMFVSYFMNFYRNHQFGIEDGSEDWGDVKTLSKTLRDKDPDRNTYVSQSIAIGFDVVSNLNMLVIGGSGSYKTTSVLMPNALRALMTNVFLDIKGDILRKTGNYLKSQGVTIKVLDLINPEKSDRYNPFAYVEKETDILRLISNIQDAATPPDAHKGDPFWDDGAALYLQALFFYEWLQAKEEKRKAKFNEVIRLANLESQKVDEEGTTALQVKMDRLAEEKGVEYPPVRDYRKLKDGAPETVKSIILIINSMLRLCEVSSMKRIFEEDDMDIKSLGLGVDGNPNKKTALFLVMPDNDPSFNFIISMFYTQMFDVLIRTADFECGGALPIHVRLWADEFYAGPKPRDTEKLMGTIRARNLSIVPMLQSISQAKALFPQDKWEIFMENCATAVYLGSGPMAFSTHKYISDLLGDMTIDRRDDTQTMGGHGNSSIQNRHSGRTLMTPAEVKRMPRQDCLIFVEGQYPIYDRKAIPFQSKLWLKAMAMAGAKGYQHPVRVIFNEKTMSYKTVTQDAAIQFLDKDDVKFYKEAEKKDHSIKVFEIDEEDFLYLNWREEPPLSSEEITEIFRQAKTEQAKIKQGELPEDVRVIEALYQEKNNRTASSEPTDREEWDLSGSIYDCMQRYAPRLNTAQLEEIIGGLEDGLSEKQIKTYFTLPAEKMNQYRRAYLFSKMEA